MRVGTKVVIIDDCRPSHRATGMKGVYEGEFMVQIEDNGGLVEFPNPRIRLEDGSVIYGIECWWKPVDDGYTLEESQRLLKLAQDWCREVGDYLKKGD